MFLFDWVLLFGDLLGYEHTEIKKRYDIEYLLSNDIAPYFIFLRVKYTTFLVLL